MLNIPNGEFTLDAFRKFLREHDDSVNRQIQVDRAGNVFFADRVGTPYDSSIKFMLEIWVEGNDYSGQNAAKDKSYVEKEYNLILDAWNNGRVGMIDF